MVKENTEKQCNQCGECNVACPVYYTLLKESAGPRFKAHIAKKNLVKEIFYLCTNCGSCISNCPAKVNIQILRRRANLVSSGVETEPNKQMKENIEEYDNPFGKIKKHMKIDKYYT